MVELVPVWLVLQGESKPLCTCRQIGIIDTINKNSFKLTITQGVLEDNQSMFLNCINYR